MFLCLHGRLNRGLGAHSARVQNIRCVSNATLGRGTGDAVRQKAADWFGRRVGTVLSWLHKTGLGTRQGAPEKKRKGMMSILADQCSFVTGQRVRRAWQMGDLYSSLYAERSRWSLASSLWRRFQARHAGAGKLVAALAGVFMWEEEKILDEELKRSASELQVMEAMKGEDASRVAQGDVDAGWEIVMEKKNFWVWRRPIVNSHLYEYRVLGTYADITPRQFFNVQLDTEYRKKWDSLVIKLDVVDRDISTGSEVVYWATHFPYPMYSRDYVYVRRYDVDVENNLMVLVSRSVEHPVVPETKDFVRVHSYQSRMVIRPHKSFDENGFDYLLTYSDDPQTAFPRYCVSWMVSSGMPDFLEKLHAAALRARNQEVGIRDYASVVKTKERLSGDAAHTAGPSQMEYA
ncbi:stAR-related lipid transfer protein 7, mitochondrial-like [Arapaima gigas]